ncbi:MAG: prepilin-type N-terminal cleavage/methylation domain-containing protein [Candidatus Pacebacteria bacterium]|nr:prepilin-type N-terminal cleavage/methylation domain-containing protein [Candidatus Paceibacterota bacterium]
MNIYKKNAYGFTLIELLMVIGVVSLLTTVVVASINSARAKALDTSIKSNLHSARAQAEMYYNNNSLSYTGVCTTPLVWSAIENARTVSGLIDGSTRLDIAEAGDEMSAVCHESSSAWAIDVPLRSNSANSWCVDSKSASRSIVGYLGSNVLVCP